MPTVLITPLKGTDEMTGYEYEKECAKLLGFKGFTDIKVTPSSGDQGVDIVAYKDGKKYGIQCKYYEGTVGNKAIQEVFAGSEFYDCAEKLIITNSTLTQPAKTLAKKLGVLIWENVDAIYIQNNDVEFNRKKRQLEKAQKEEARKRRADSQERLYLRYSEEFENWKTSFLAAHKARELQIQEWESELKEKREKSLKSLENKTNSSIAALTNRITQLESEKKETELASAKLTLVQLPRKIQMKKRMKVIATEINAIWDQISSIKHAYQCEEIEINNTYRCNIVELSNRAKKRIKLPETPEVVERLMRKPLFKLIMQTAGKPEADFPYDRVQYLILQILYRSSKKMTLAEIVKSNSEVDHHAFKNPKGPCSIGSTIDHLVRLGIVGCDLNGKVNSYCIIDKEKYRLCIEDALVCVSQYEVDQAMYLLNYKSPQISELRHQILGEIVSAIENNGKMSASDLISVVSMFREKTALQVGRIVNEYVTEGSLSKIRCNGHVYYELPDKNQ